MRTVGLVAFLGLIGPTAAASKPDVIDLPVGFFPGGIALGSGQTVYVGSNTDGSIWKGHLRTGEGEIVLVGGGAPEMLDFVKQTSYFYTLGVSGVVPNAPGLDYDKRSGYLFVAGGYSGIRIYDDQYEIVAEYDFDGANRASFVGDVTITKKAAYFTDSIQLKIHKVELNKDNGGLANGANDPVETITLGPDVSSSGEGIDLNGIEATRNGKMLVVGHTTKNQLFSVDPDTGDTNRIDLGNVEISPDGLVLRKDSLWVVENGDFGGPEQVTEISLSSDLLCGSVAPKTLKSELFNNPSKMIRKGNSLYAVNAKFEELAQDRGTTSYEIVRVDRDSGEITCPDQ